MDELNQKLNELNKKLAEWRWGKEKAGAHLYTTLSKSTTYPQADRRIEQEGEWKSTVSPDFTGDLNACTRGLVPKLLEEYNIESYSFRQEGAGIDNWYYSETNIWKTGKTQHGFEVLRDEHIAGHFEKGSELDKITPLAFCRALEKLIDKQEAERTK